MATMLTPSLSATRDSIPLKIGVMNEIRATRKLPADSPDALLGVQLNQPFCHQ